MLFANDIELAILAMDEEGKIKDGAKDTAQLKLRAGNLCERAEKRHPADTPAGVAARDATSCGSAPAKATAAPSGR